MVYSYKRENLCHDQKSCNHITKLSKKRDNITKTYLLWLAIFPSNSCYNYMTSLCPITIHHSIFHFLQDIKTDLRWPNNKSKREEEEKMKQRNHMIHLVIPNFHVIHLIRQPINTNSIPIGFSQARSRRYAY